MLSVISSALYNIRDPEKRKDNDVACKAGWLENGMIVDETNKWYWAPHIYDRFSHAEDPEGVTFRLATSLCPREAKAVLDVGSGTGRFIEELKERHPRMDVIYALDSSKEMIAYLTKKFEAGSPSVKPLQATIEDIPLPNESIDLVVSSWGFPSRVWDKDLAMRELCEIHRVMKEGASLITIGWDEDFSDEMTEVWYKFVTEETYYFDSLSEYRRRKRSRITSPRNCGLTVGKKRLQVPVKFADKREAAYVFGHLFGYSAGVWILQNSRREFQMRVSITKDDKASLGNVLQECVPSDVKENQGDHVHVVDGSVE